MTRGRQRIRPTSAGRLERDDQTLVFKAGESPVQCARLEPHTAEAIDVLEDPIPVLLAASEAGKDQQAWVGQPSKVVPHLITPNSV